MNNIEKAETVALTLDYSRGPRLPKHAVTCQVQATIKGNSVTGHIRQSAGAESGEKTFDYPFSLHSDSWAKDILGLSTKLVATPPAPSSNTGGPSVFVKLSGASLSTQSARKAENISDWHELSLALRAAAKNQPLAPLRFLCIGAQGSSEVVVTQDVSRREVSMAFVKDGKALATVPLSMDAFRHITASLSQLRPVAKTAVRVDQKGFGFYVDPGIGYLCAWPSEVGRAQTSVGAQALVAIERLYELAQVRPPAFSFELPTA